ncbi:MAG TPA: YbaK/EbsC family protein, partial [Candidatus Competibacter sp.]|nr:YbaK/EbsC family protein [Candidatus Competibacter sp.]
MNKIKFSMTPAIRFLRDHQVAFSVHPYAYEEHGGTAHSAHCLGVDEHCVIKTLIMENDQRHPLIVLMHGDRKVSTRELARLLGVKTIHPCDPATAHKHSGYLIGGTSPF